MSAFHSIYQTILNLPLSVLVKTISIPSDPIKQCEIDTKRPIVYVLPFQSYTDLLTLRKSCIQLGLPDPLTYLEIAGKTLPRYLFVSSGKPMFDNQDPVPSEYIDLFSDLLDLHHKDRELDIQLVPVSIVWNRNPGKETRPAPPALQAMNALQKFYTILTLGRDSMVRFNHSLSLRYLADHYEETDKKIALKLARVARIHFARQKWASSGPRLPNRQALFKRLLASKAIEKAVQNDAEKRNIPVAKARKEAFNMLEEIAANFSPTLVRYSDTILTWLWNRLYQGIIINNAQRVRKLAHDGHEIVYVPCHRSHMDYLLLSYILYKEGLAPPHIAAGVNLNFFPTGPIFRRGGAFFLRRIIKDNPLYSTVFREYLAELFSKGYSMEFFPEGGRSRTGRLLQAKTGMLAMTIQAMLRGLKRPVSIVPVYIGYEHVMEVNTYAKELQGEQKKKENLFQIIGIMKKLRNYGKGYVNFGEPINVNQFLTNDVPDWKQYINPIETQRPPWLNPLVNSLAECMMERINDATAANALTLCATALLASRQRALSREALESQITIYIDLLRNVPYSSSCTFPEETVPELIEHAISLNKFIIDKDSLGEIISLDRKQTILMTYYRNNIIHLLVIPSLIAEALIFNACISLKALHETVIKLYPFLKAELHMGFDETSLDIYFNNVIRELERQKLFSIENGILQRNRAKLTQLQLLARIVAETLQRYAMTLTLFSHEPDASKLELEKQSQMMAQRLNRLHGINTPEFFDKTIFSTLFSTLTKEGYLDNEAHAKAKEIETLRECVLGLISPEVQLTMQAILNQATDD